jgi:hypothetical protein
MPGLRPHKPRISMIRPHRRPAVVIKRRQHVSDQYFFPFGVAYVSRSDFDPGLF